MNQYMRKTLELALHNIHEDGGSIFTGSINELHKLYDMNGDAEFRNAQSLLQIHDLVDFTMNASGNRCPMRLYDVGITDVYYCASIEDATEVGINASQVIYNDLKKPNEERTLFMKQMPFEKDQENLMKMWEQCYEN